MTDPAVDPRVARTRQVVLAAAAEALVVDGFERVSIDAIAERSGVARSTIYRNWPSRAVLLIEAFASLLDTPAVDGDSLEEALTRHARFFADGFAREPWGQVVPSLIGAAAHDEELGAALHEFSAARRAALATIVSQAVERGEIAPPVDTAASLLRFVGALFFAALVARQQLDDAFVARQVRLTLDELGRP